MDMRKFGPGVEMLLGFQQKLAILSKVLHVFLLNVYNATELKQDLPVYKCVYCNDVNYISGFLLSHSIICDTGYANRSYNDIMMVLNPYFIPLFFPNSDAFGPSIWVGYLRKPFFTYS